MAVSKHEYYSWKSSEVYEEFKETVVQELDSYIAQLVNTAGNDSKTDVYTRGRIDGLKALLEWEPDFNREEDDADS